MPIGRSPNYFGKYISMYNLSPNNCSCVFQCQSSKSISSTSLSWLHVSQFFVSPRWNKNVWFSALCIPVFMYSKGLSKNLENIRPVSWLPFPICFTILRTQLWSLYSFFFSCRSCIVFKVSFYLFVGIVSKCFLNSLLFFCNNIVDVYRT